MNINKYSSFFLACTEKVENLEKGNIIHLKEVSPKKVKTSFFIRIKDYDILEKSAEIENSKDINYNDGIFKDDEGNNIFEKKRRKSGKSGKS